MACAVERDRAPDDPAVGAEPAPPQRFAEDDHPRAAPLLIVRLQVSPDQRRDAEHAKERRRDGAAAQQLGISLAGERGGRAVEGADRFEALRALRPGQIVERRDPHRAGVGMVLEQLDEPVWLRVRQRAQQDGVGDAEDRGARADAERERQDRGGGDHRRPPQAAPRVAKVLLQHAQVFRRRRPDHIHDEAGPEPPPRLPPAAIAIELRHLAAELVAKVARVEPQQPLVPALSRRPALHGVLRLAVRPTARAWRSSVVSRSASAWAASRPSGVSR